MNPDISKDELIDRFSSLGIWKGDTRKAPHKPILLLLALAKCSQDQGRLITYKHLSEEFPQIIKSFFPSVKTSRTHYPFWRLQKDGLWEVDEAQSFQENNSGDVSSKELIKKEGKGGFPKPIFNLLKMDPQFREEIVYRILDDHFPSSLHDSILEAIQFQKSLPDRKYYHTVKVARDSRFREEVVNAYENQCAICGFSLKIRDTLIGIEAAHIKWVQYGGPDWIKNGLALCALHHKLFDSGAFSLSDTMTVIVSDKAKDDSGDNPLAKIHDQKPVFIPKNAYSFPSKEFLDWHRKEVFHEPPLKW